LSYIPEKSDTHDGVSENDVYNGRIALFEMMYYTDDIKNLILQGKSVFDVEQYAL